MIDSLHLPHLDEPDPDVLSSCLQNPLAVVLRLIQNLLGEEGVGGRDLSNTSLPSQDRMANWILLSKKGCQETVLFFP